MIKDDIEIKSFEEPKEEPLVYNRISDAMESGHKTQMKNKQNKIILKNTRNSPGALDNGKGTYQSKRRLFKLYHSLSFIDNHYTVGGYLACILSFLALVFMIYCLFVSVHLRGAIGTQIGFFALFSFLFALFAFIIGLKSFKEEEKNYLFSKIGSYFSLILIIFWIVMYFRGLFIR